MKEVPEHEDPVKSLRRQNVDLGKIPLEETQKAWFLYRETDKPSAPSVEIVTLLCIVYTTSIASLKFFAELPNWAITALITACGIHLYQKIQKMEKRRLDRYNYQKLLLNIVKNHPEAVKRKI